jgi:hypothetical protein
MRRRFDSHKCEDVKPWVIAAINDESRYPPDRLWRKEPTEEFAYEERLRRIKFLRKYAKKDSRAIFIAHRLESPTAMCRIARCQSCTPRRGAQAFYQACHQV